MEDTERRQTEALRERSQQLFQPACEPAIEAATGEDETSYCAAATPATAHADCATARDQQRPHSTAGIPASLPACTNDKVTGGVWRLHPHAAAAAAVTTLLRSSDHPPAS